MMFHQAWYKICGLQIPSLLGINKSRVLHTELIKTRNLTGSMAEIGVYCGATAKLLQLQFPNRPLHLYDTFHGIARSDKRYDEYRDGDFGGIDRLPRVKALLGTTNVLYHPGIFPDTFNPQHGPFSFVHSDTDTYYGTKATIEHILPLVQPGGVVIFDDYDNPKCSGVNKAIAECLRGDYETRICGEQFIVNVKL